MQSERWKLGDVHCLLNMLCYCAVILHALTLSMSVIVQLQNIILNSHLNSGVYVRWLCVVYGIRMAHIELLKT